MLHTTGNGLMRTLHSGLTAPKRWIGSKLAEQMLAYQLAIWLLQVMGLFVVFTVQGAMWKGAQDENRNGWVIALLWAVAVATLFIPMHELIHRFFIEQQGCNP